MDRAGRDEQPTAASLLARAWPVALALGLLAALVGWALHTALALTGGHFA